MTKVVATFEANQAGVPGPPRTERAHYLAAGATFVAHAVRPLTDQVIPVVTAGAHL